ncbi:hypothetical protein [Leucobacter japonicus]|uniref:hypothetical protein n=1 Tax=Leucobacter japonicus TaxID=1461259 RepID=UPI0006A7DCF1|nr:hypothetical protein [Leucobacter japonicus]
MTFVVQCASECEAALPDMWSLSPIGAVIGLLVFQFLALARGWLIPRLSHERELQAMKDRSDEWRAASEAGEKVCIELLEQNRMLLEAQRITDHFYQAVTPIVAAKGDGNAAA